MQPPHIVRDLSRLFRPKSIAVIGGGAWCRAVVAQLVKAGFAGDIWPVHPKGGTWGEISVYQTLSDLPTAPDSAFVGVNRTLTIEMIASLSQMGAGGAVCFASGFAEVADGQDLHRELLKAAGNMPILGPNCYGFINACDGALLWPDQHGCLPTDRGVAILTQSSNIAINLTMQNRALPISYVVTCGNQAQTSQAEIALALLDDPRVTAIGLHVEGFGDLRTWEALARRARQQNIPLIALKVGRSQEAQSATVSHTASLAGADAGTDALLARLGIARVDDLATLLETLKILHIAGPLSSANIATISCSGGEASLAADIALPLGLRFPPLNQRQSEDLFAALGAKVALANPLDYHTYIWRNTPAMTAAFSAMIDPILALTALIVDFPRSDRCDPADWDCVIDAALATKAATRGTIAMIATLPELMPEHIAMRLCDGGVIPLYGLSDGLRAIAAAIKRHPTDTSLSLIYLPPIGPTQTLNEAQAKQALANHGLPVPQMSRIPDEASARAVSFTFPVALKGEGFAHKTEAGAVVLNISDIDSLCVEMNRMNAKGYLVEQMVTGTVAELLIGVVRDPAVGFVMTIGAGGTLTELLTDTVSLLLPISPATAKQALTQLKCYKILSGYRGKTAADMPAIITAILAIQAYALANSATLAEVEVNPLICTRQGAIAVDALIRIAHD